jgi:DNA mismatch repair ATPase MutS
MTSKDWVLPMAERQISKWLMDPDTNGQSIWRVTETITFAGTIEALEFVARVFANTNDARKWIEEAITSKFGWRDPNFITMFYYALESKNALISEVAREVIPGRLKDLEGAALHIWATALLERHHGMPTALDLLKDPLIKARGLGIGIHPEELNRTLLRYAKQAYDHKQAFGDKKLP